MSIHTYDRDPGYDGKTFPKVIEAAMPGKAFTVACYTECVITFADELTVGEISDLDDAVSGFSQLSELKEQKAAEVDARTLELVNLYYTTGDGTIASIVSAGVALKNSIDAAQNTTVLGAISDNR